jgi:hypothetical protein
MIGRNVQEEKLWLDWLWDIWKNKSVVVQGVSVQLSDFFMQEKRLYREAISAISDV